MERDRYRLAMDFYDKSVKDADGQAGKATAYGSKKSRLLRYRAAGKLPFFDAEQWSESRILDVGCGPGQFFSWLHERKQMKMGTYAGIDPNAGMIELAKNRGVPNVRVGDVFDSDEKFDWVVANCIFASAFVDNWIGNFDIFAQTISKMWERCEKGMCFDVVWANEDGVVRDVQPGYHELQFKIDTVLQYVNKTMTNRVVIDRATSDRFFTVYAYKRPQLFERLTDEELE